jgi:hypothetical protein
MMSCSSESAAVVMSGSSESASVMSSSSESAAVVVSSSGDQQQWWSAAVVITCHVGHEEFFGVVLVVVHSLGVLVHKLLEECRMRDIWLHARCHVVRAEWRRCWVAPT